MYHSEPGAMESLKKKIKSLEERFDKFLIESYTEKIVDLELRIENIEKIFKGDGK